MNVFRERKFYPGGETPIKEHYAGTFDSVFLAFIPFFRVDEGRLSKSSFQLAHQITYAEFKSANPDLNLPDNKLAVIYSNENPEYPTNDEIRRYGSPLRWSEVWPGCGFASPAELNRALKTAIGGYSAVFSRQDLVDGLSKYADREHIFLPAEGTFDIFTKLSILRTFRRLGKALIVVEGEFLEKKVTLDIRELTDEEFCNKIEYKDYYIYDVDEEILFAIDWDDFFFLIAATPQTLEQVLAEDSFEGFVCDDKVKVFWELGDDEQQAGLAKNAGKNKGNPVYKWFSRGFARMRRI